MTSPFEVGDVVQLRSGGERMTVEEISGEGITCVWFDGKGVNRQTFPAAVLKLYKAPGGSIPVTRA